MKVGHEFYLQGCVWNYTQCAYCQRMGCLTWNTSCHVSFTLQPCRITNLLQIWETGRFNLVGDSGAISLLSVKFLSMANDVFFRLPFAKVEEMEKNIQRHRDHCHRHADVPKFRDSLQSNLKRKNMWEQLKSGKLHTILCTWSNCVTDFVFHHRFVDSLASLDSEELWADNREEESLKMALMKMLLLWVWG